MGFRLLGFNVWRDANGALGGPTDPLERDGALGALVVTRGGREWARAYGFAFQPGDDPVLFVFLGGRFVGIDRFAGGYGDELDDDDELPDGLQPRSEADWWPPDVSDARISEA